MDKKTFTIKQWAESDRPREKMVAKGAPALSDAELLAILIGTGNPEESAVHLSQRILYSIGNNLNQLGKLTVKQLVKEFRGIGNAKAITILAALELGKRYGSSVILQENKVTSSNEAFRIFYPLVSNIQHEELWIAILNQGSFILDKIKISQGGISGTTADMRVILKPAINKLASGIILCHNHPSGNLQPSPQDDKLTRRLKEAAELIDIKLLDHIIVADNSYFSYADEGRIL